MNLQQAIDLLESPVIIAGQIAEIWSKGNSVHSIKEGKQFSQKCKWANTVEMVSQQDVL